MVLRYEIEQKVCRHGSGVFVLDDKLLQAFLGAGRYLHGSRSISALIESCQLPSDGAAEKPASIGWGALPEDHLIAAQVDRGPLDCDILGGSIALSGFRPTRAMDEHFDECWQKVAAALWDAGATIAYGGRWRSGALTQNLAILLQSRSRELRHERDPRPAFLQIFLKDLPNDSSNQAVESDLTPTKCAEYGIELVRGNYMDDNDRTLPSDLREVVERFRRRLAVSEASVARFVIGGHDEDGSKQRSGIVEEMVISLALGQPIYVAGAFGGAAKEVGPLLGLASVRTGTVPALFQYPDPGHVAELTRLLQQLRPPPWPDLPVWPNEQAEFLQKHSLLGPQWPNNGLTVPENRELFACDDPNRVAELVTQGLCAVAAKRTREA